MQGLRGRGHLPAPAHQEHMQGVRGRVLAETTNSLPTYGGRLFVVSATYGGRLFVVSARTKNPREIEENTCDDVAIMSLMVL